MTTQAVVQKEIEFLNHWVHSSESLAEWDAVDLQRAIALAAYSRAEKRGFAPGYELSDWLAAESEIRHQMRRLRPPAD
ncbi:MAG: DUF2934 domain-containing protein [Methylotetracoccus sp.]|jgi:hypothetical protein|nr:DUF2934 domain-containing protein [Methylotetracoccus sp.]